MSFVPRITAISAGLLAMIGGVMLPQGLAPEHVRYASEHSPWTPEERAAALGITIVWTHTPCGHPETEWGGCFDATHPTQIQVAIYNGTYDTFAKYTILHELSHVRQWQWGLPMTECGADDNAVRWGAPFSAYDCPGLLSYENWELEQTAQADPLSGP